MQRVILEIMAPAWSNKELLATQSLFEALHSVSHNASTSTGYSLEILATKCQGVRFLWVIPLEQEQTIRRLLESYCPDFIIFKRSDYEWVSNKHTVVLNCQLSNSLKQNLRVYSALDTSDPLSYLTGSLVKLEEGEQIVYQTLIYPAKSNRTGSAQKILNLINNITNTCLALFQMNPPASTDNTKEMIAKTDTLLFRANLRVLITASNLDRLQVHSQSLKASLSLFNSSKHALAIKSHSKAEIIQRFQTRQLLRYRRRVYLNSIELAGLYHFPHTDNSSSEAINRTLSKILPAKTQQTGKNHILLGENHHQEQITPIGLSEEERKRHLYIVGGTGTGKTSLLQYQIVQDIKQGRGVAVIDPHGDLATDLLKHIPKKRIKDVIYFNPIDYKHPIGVNLLHLPPNLTGDQLEHAKDIRTEAMISVLMKVFHNESNDIGHRIEYILRNTIQTAFTVTDPNLFTLYKILNDKIYNKQIVRNLKDPYLKMFWRNEIGLAGSMQKVKMQAGVTAKIGRFIFSTSVKKAFNQIGEDCLDFNALINKKRILICNFSKGLIGEDASRLFSTTVLAKIQLTALEQVNKEFVKRKPFYLYVDEFQNFATQSFVDMLSEARKYGLNLIMAQQSMQQQNSSRLTESILANTGNLITFRTGSVADTKLLSSIFQPFISETDIANLPAYNFYMKSTALEAKPPVSGRTKMLSSSRKLDTSKIVCQASRRQFTVSTVH